MKTTEIEFQPANVMCPVCPDYIMTLLGRQSDGGYVYECTHLHPELARPLRIWLPPIKIHAIEVDE